MPKPVMPWDPKPIEPCAVAATEPQPTSLETSINQAHIAGLMLHDLSTQIAEKYAYKPEEVQKKAYEKAWDKLPESQRRGLNPPEGK